MRAPHRIRGLGIAVVLCFGIDASGTARYYVSPGGSRAGDGSRNHPWDLATALSGGRGTVRPGDTIWLRGGTYPGGFDATLTGTSATPIVVRQYPGERATIDGNLHVHGAYAIYWGFEIKIGRAHV